MSSHNSGNNSNYDVSIPVSSSVSNSIKRRHSHSLKKKTPKSKNKMRKYHSVNSSGVKKSAARMVYSPKRKNFKRTSSQLKEDQIKFKINLKKTRKKFLKKLAANNLNMDVQYEYIMALVKITESLDKNISKYIFKKFNFQGTNYEILNFEKSKNNSNNIDSKYNLSVFGGIQFFLIYWQLTEELLNDKKLKKTIENS